MGSEFFGRIMGGEPTSKWIDPGIQKWFDPLGAQLNQSGRDYNALHSSTFAPGAYAGKTPTLADANAGYVPKAAVNAPIAPANGGTPAPLYGAQPPVTGIAPPARVPLGMQFQPQAQKPVQPQPGVWG